MQALAFNPIYQERVWGARTLESQLARNLPPKKKIGESWEIVDRSEAQSHVSNGPFQGQSLHKLLQDKGTQIMGPEFHPGRRFPLLVKWLDCSERLSLQVHPPKEISEHLGGEPKTECWYIHQSQANSAVLAGFTHPMSKADFEQALKAENLEPYICRLKTKPGDFLFVPSGRIHAIDAGNLILEIQQNSDSTYRVYDWGRKGLDGKPRELHVEKSLQSIDFNDIQPRLTHLSSEKEETLVDEMVFRLRKFDLASGETLILKANEEAKLIHCLSEGITLNGEKIPVGSNWLLPYCSAFEITANQAARILLTDHFSG